MEDRIPAIQSDASHFAGEFHAQNRLDHPGNLGGSEPWEDAGSWRHRGSTREDLGEHAVKMVLEVREGKGDGEVSRVPGSEIAGTRGR